LPANGLGLLVLVVAVLGLHLLDLGNVLLLRLLGADAILDGRLPRVVLGLALGCVSVSVFVLGIVEPHLEVEHARLGRSVKVLARSDLIEGWGSMSVQFPG
jgi:hypothetical protein